MYNIWSIYTYVCAQVYGRYLSFVYTTVCTKLDTKWTKTKYGKTNMKFVSLCLGLCLWFELCCSVGRSFWSYSSGIMQMTLPLCVCLFVCLSSIVCLFVALTGESAFSLLSVIYAYQSVKCKTSRCRKSGVDSSKIA